MELENEIGVEVRQAALKRVAGQLKTLGFKRQSLEVGSERFTKLLPIRQLERICTSEAILMQELEDAEDGIVVVEFVAGWCDSCEFIYAPRITRVAEKFARNSAEDIIFLKVDVDRVPGAAKAFDITYTPEFLFFRNGDEIGRFAGHSHRHFEEALSGLLDDEQWDENAIPESNDVRPFYHHHKIDCELPPQAAHKVHTKDTNPLYLTTSRVGFGAAGIYAMNKNARIDRLLK
eukprot:g4137.t1